MERRLNAYNKAKELRSQGHSIRNIARQLDISTSTASIWCRGVILTDRQRQKLEERGKGREALRVFARKRHEDKVIRMNAVYKASRQDISQLRNEQLFLVGLALYWAEGFKNMSEQRVGFCNSDSRMINLLRHKWRRIHFPS